MGTQKESGRRGYRKSPQRRVGGGGGGGERESRKKWQLHKGAWNSWLRGLCFFTILYILPLCLPPSLSRIWLRLLLNLGTLPLCQPWCNWGESYPARSSPGGGSFKSALLFSPAPSLDLPPLFVFHLCRTGEGGGFKTPILQGGGAENKAAAVWRTGYSLTQNPRCLMGPLTHAGAHRLLCSRRGSVGEPQTGMGRK